MRCTVAGCNQGFAPAETHWSVRQRLEHQEDRILKFTYIVQGAGWLAIGYPRLDSERKLEDTLRMERAVHTPFCIRNA